MKGLTCLWRNLACPRAAGILAVVIAFALTAEAQTSIFSIQKTPNPNPRGNTLNAVAAISTSNAWAVGFQNDNQLNGSRTLTQRWTGTTWITIPSPNPGSTSRLHKFQYRKCSDGGSGCIQQ